MAELHIDTENKLRITPKDLTGVLIAVLGIPGSGKSNSIGVLIEENVPYNTGITIFDMHDEYWGLKQKFPFLRVGKNQPFRKGAEHKSPPVDLELTASNAANFAEHVFLKRIPVIINLRWMSKDERQELVLNYLQRLYELNMSYARPYWVVLEEAHTFIPEGRKTPELEKIIEMVSEGRKLGFTFALGSQRTAKIDKDVLSSANVLILHRVSIELDVRSYRGLLPAEINKQKDLFITMRPGQAVVKWQNQGLPRYDIVQIRQQTTFHVGATPDADDVPMPKLQTIDMSTLGILDIKAAKSQPAAAALAKQPNINSMVTHAAEIEAKYKRINTLQTLTIALLASRRMPAFITVPPGTALPELPPYEPQKRTQISVAPLNHTLMTNGGLSKQERAFNALLRDVVNGCKNPFHVTILRYLTEREGSWMAVSQIARFVGLSESTIRKHPPLYLCQSPLILLQRTRSGGDYCYKSIARETLAERFPDLPTDELVQRLLEVGT